MATRTGAFVQKPRSDIAEDVARRTAVLGDRIDERVVNAENAREALARFATQSDTMLSKLRDLSSGVNATLHKYAIDLQHAKDYQGFERLLSAVGLSQQADRRKFARIERATATEVVKQIANETAQVLQTFEERKVEVSEAIDLLQGSVVAQQEKLRKVAEILPGLKTDLETKRIAAEAAKAELDALEQRIASEDVAEEERTRVEENQERTMRDLQLAEQLWKDAMHKAELVREALPRQIDQRRFFQGTMANIETMERTLIERWEAHEKLLETAPTMLRVHASMEAFHAMDQALVKSGEVVAETGVEMLRASAKVAQERADAALYEDEELARICRAGAEGFRTMADGLEERVRRARKPGRKPIDANSGSDGNGPENTSID